MQFTTIALSVVLFFMSIGEKAIAACKEEHRYWYDYDYGNLTTVCYPHLSWGVGIWCSILVSYFLINSIKFFN